jgi:hypothetical protein
MTTDPHQAEISQKEKRRVLRDDAARLREQGSTLRDFADSGFGNEGRQSGRFSKLDDKPVVHRLPANSPWSGTQNGPGDEPPLGYSVDDLSLQKSDAVAPAPPSVENATDERGGQERQPPCAAPTSSKDE